MGLRGRGGEARFAFASLPGAAAAAAAAEGAPLVWEFTAAPEGVCTVAADLPTATPEELKIVRIGFGGAGGPPGALREKYLFLEATVPIGGRSRDPRRHSAHLVRSLHA